MTFIGLKYKGAVIRWFTVKRLKMCVCSETEKEKPQLQTLLRRDRASTSTVDNIDEPSANKTRVLKARRGNPELLPLFKRGKLELLHVRTTVDNFMVICVGSLCLPPVAKLIVSMV